MCNLTKTADYLTDELRKLRFVIMSEGHGKGLPLVAFRFPGEEEGETEEQKFDEFALAHYLRSRGWVIPAYTMAPETGQMKMMRIVVREDFSRSRCELLIKDIKLCTELLEKDSEQFIMRVKQHIGQHTSGSGKIRDPMGSAKAVFKVCCVLGQTLNVDANGA